MINEIENFINDDHRQEMEDLLLSNSFPWYYHTGTVQLDTDADKFVIQQGINPPQFVHVVANESTGQNPFFPAIIPVIENIANYYKSDVQLLRAKFNLLYKSDNSTFHYPHTDTKYPTGNIKTAIFYINDCDGDTHLFENFSPYDGKDLKKYKQISPEKGKIIIFEAKRFHSSSSPVSNTNRLVLNLVFKLV